MKKKATVIINDTDYIDRFEKFKKQLDAANEKSFGIIEGFFDSGYIEFLSKLLVYLPESRRDEALAKLPEEVSQKVKAMFDAANEKTNTDPEVLSAAGTVLKHAGFYGKACANEVTSNDIFPTAQVNNELEQLYKKNPLLAMNIDYYKTDMRILLGLDDRAIQKWLREVDQQDLAKALKGLENEIQDKVFRNMSRRVATMLREDMEFMGPVRQSDIIETQKKLIGILSRLEEKGEIVISWDTFPDIGDKLIS